MSDDLVLGIDLGTTNSVVAVADGGQARVLANEEGNRLLPSVVSFHPEGRILVGEEARERRLIDARNTVYSVKRLIGRPFETPEVRRAQERFAFSLVRSANGGVVVDVRGETYTLTEISAFVLREIKRVAEVMLGQPVSRAVITVPANFNELQRSATKAAGRVAGLAVARIVNEPTAAALAYGVGRNTPAKVAVYDFGGGTFDMTVLELDGDVVEVLATAGDTFLGGDDIDLVIAETMADAFLEAHRWDPRQDEQAFERLRAAAEWAKCQLSSRTEVRAQIEELAYGPSGALDLDFRMTRPRLEDLIRPLVARSFDVCRDALATADLQRDDLDDVILVGGSTRIPLIREMVLSYFGREPRTDIDPDLVVAQGAAIHGFALGGERKASQVKARPMTAEDLRAAQARRKERQKALPKQPAFAPTGQREAALPPARPGRGTRPPPAVPELPPSRSPDVLSHRAVPIGAPPAPSAPAAPPPPVAPRGAATPRGPAAPPAPRPAKPIAPPPPSVRTKTRTTAGMAPPPPPPGAPNDEPRDSIEIDPSYLAESESKAPGLFHTSDPFGELEIDVADESDPLEPEETLDVAIEGSGAFELDMPDTPPTDGSGPLVLDGLFPGGPPDGGADSALTGFFPDDGNHEGSAPIDLSLSDALPGAGSVSAPLPAALFGESEPPPANEGRTLPEPRSALESAAGNPHADAFADTMAGLDLDLPDPDAPDGMTPDALVPETLSQESMALDAASDVMTSDVITAQPVVLLPDRPLLMDVTPMSLGIETVGGYCQHLIGKNAPIPAEQTRTFTTATDDQDTVRVSVCQGESKSFADNQMLGEVELSGLRALPRGALEIQVTFIIDANGTLQVKAVDTATGLVQETHIHLLGGVDEDEVARMEARQRALLGDGP